MGQITVLVKNKQTGEERQMTYHAYRDTSHLFDLIGEVDEQGNLIPGNPNLQTRHQSQKSVAVPAADSGMTLEEKERMKEELTAKFTVKPKIPLDEPPVVEQKKRGPKPKLQEA